MPCSLINAHQHSSPFYNYTSFVCPGRMVSGNGVKGGRGRCYTLWVDFMSCLARNDSTSLKICTHEREDYLECLHHAKLVSELCSPSLLSLSPSPPSNFNLGVLILIKLIIL